MTDLDAALTAIEPYYADDLVTLYHGDAEEILATEQVTVPVVITDPPYNVSKAYDGYSDDLERSEYVGWLRRVFAALPGDTLVYFPGTRNVLDAPQVLGDWQFHRMLGWHKKEYAGDLWTNGPAMCWEPIVWAHRWRANL